MAGVVDTKVRISLIDEVSNNLRRVQGQVEGLNNSFGSLARAGSVLAASFLSFDRVASGLTAIVNSGVNFNKTIETASVGMSGVLLSMTKLEERELKWNEAMNISRSIIKDLNKQALLTAATPQELTQTFSGLMGIGIGRGLNIEEIKKLTVMGVNAVKSMGLEGRQLIQELRDLLQGSISPQKSTLATALGITTADIKKAQNSAEGLFKFLESRMNGFKISANYFPNTFQGATAVLSGAFQMLIAEGLEAPMKKVTNLQKELFTSLLNEDQSGFSTTYTEPIKEAGKYLTKLVDGMKDLGKASLNVASAVGWVVEPIAKGFIDNIELAAVGFLAWKSSLQWNKQIAAETLDVYSQINKTLNDGRATLAATAALEKSRAELATISQGQKRENLYSGMLATKGKMNNPAIEQAKYQESLEKAALKYREVMNSGRLHPQSTQDLRVFTQDIAKFQTRLQMLGLNQLEVYRTATKVAEAFPKMGGSALLAEQEMQRYVKAIMLVRNENRQLVAENAQFTAFTAQLSGFGARIEKMGVSAANSIAIQKQLISVYKQSGIEAAMSMMNTSLATAKATEMQNKWAALSSKIQYGLSGASSSAMGLGMALSIVGEKMDNDFMGKAGGWITTIGMLATSFQMLWASMNPATAAITITGTAIFAAIKKLKGEDAAKRAGFGEDFWGWYGKQFGTREEYERAALQKRSQTLAARKKDGTASDKDNTADKLIAKFKKTEEASAKAAKENAKTVKLLDDAEKVSASIAAKLAERTMTNREQAFANLNKEIATFQSKIDTLKNSGQDVQALQEQLDSYSIKAAAKLEEKFNTLKIRWDDVIIHIRNSQTNLTDIISAGYDSMANDFVNFGQNIITEGGNFMDRFNDLFKNFANNICNTLMKIYMQGLLTKSVLGLLGGGINTSWLNGATENASGLLSIGNYIVGHANGGVASGWSLVGEQGPELVNFSNPGRVYTNEETRSMLGGNNVNVKVNVINESGQQLNATQRGDATFDGESYVINVVLNAFATNKGGMRNILQGGRA